MVLMQLNPFKIICLWIIVCVIFSIIAMLTLAGSTSGGEQAPLSLLGYMIPITIYGVLTLSIFTIPFFKSWVKQFWYVNVVGIIIGAAFALEDWKQNKNQPKYSYSLTHLSINEKDYYQKIEYYDGFNKIRSISFCSQNKKDSLWIVYDENGKIIQQDVYKNDTLIKKIK
jgi:hypothetical protein